MLISIAVLLVAWVGEDSVVVFGVCPCRSYSTFRSGEELVVDHLPVDDAHVLFHEIFRVPLRVSGARRFVVLS
jgi:hypothetical protein